jgi:hypothetical protein
MEEREKRVTDFTEKKKGEERGGVNGGKKEGRESCRGRSGCNERRGRTVGYECHETG